MCLDFDFSPWLKAFFFVEHERLVSVFWRAPPPKKNDLHLPHVCFVNEQLDRNSQKSPFGGFSLEVYLYILSCIHRHAGRNPLVWLLTARELRLGAVRNCWWFRNPGVHQLRWVVCPIKNSRFWYTSQVFGLGISEPSTVSPGFFLWKKKWAFGPHLSRTSKPE